MQSDSCQPASNHAFAAPAYRLITIRYSIENSISCQDARRWVWRPDTRAVNRGVCSARAVWYYERGVTAFIKIGSSVYYKSGQ